MWLPEMIEYLRDPYLVAMIQQFFGIKIDSNEKHAKIFRSNHKNQQINDYNTCEEIFNERVEGDMLQYKKEAVKSDKHKHEHTSMELEYPHFTITNHFWYYLFLFGTQLGDEIFYSAFIPFWFWNIDGAVGRRVVLVWAIVMTIGQALKDIICWPRPACPPAVRLQSKWSQEYGMPSTHAMIGVSIPFSVVLFTMTRYIYSFPIGCTIAFLWCTLVCTSRLYLGMHTILDIVVGLLLAVLLMIPLVPLVDITDYYILTNVWMLMLLIVASIVTVVYYPCSDRWTPTRGDTTMVVSVTAGVHVGAWLNYKTGALLPATSPPPYNIIWPSYPMLGCMILRTILGFCSIIGTKALCKSLSYATMCAILKVNSHELTKSGEDLNNKNTIAIDLVYKYITCFMIGVNTVYLLPNVFTMIGIERPTFYTEM